ncbi:hypothetical protein C1646_774993 [Rhizophagus diaphanus]|nr:hypothetical protein C1646_774993 [Rhizophagus diaphanus] [Rhizophagus sp. MUCL 43196]
MPDVHTLWNSSTLGEEKKMANSPSNKYLTNSFRRKAKATSRVSPKKLRDSTSEKLDKVINYTLFLVDKYEKIKDDFHLLKQQYCNIYNENQIAIDKQHIQSLTVELERLKSQYIVMQTTAAQHEIK